MSQTIANIQRKINVADDLQAVVRTMKAMAASSIGQYDKSIHSLSDYYRTVELGLGVSLREFSSQEELQIPFVADKKSKHKKIIMIVFGSDQGLVGQFNRVIADYAIAAHKNLEGEMHVWSVGQRVSTYLLDAGLDLKGSLNLPTSVKAITPLVGQVLTETNIIDSDYHQLYLVYNQRTLGGVYKSNAFRLLPFDKKWQTDLMKCKWPTKNLPEVIGNGLSTLKALIREYIFVSIFRACAESLASENASRLSSMQRADKNIEELLNNLRSKYHRLRQSKIDEELFDVISGFEALSDDSQTKAYK
jgi:F-type H+-transporting ATPase subunit gamma